MGLAPIVGSIAKAAIPSLLGGLFGGKSKSQTTRTNFKQIVEDAQAAGFNPLTALRATGGAGNRTVTEPAMSSSEFIRNALTDGITAGLSYDPLARQRQQLEVDILKAELDRMSDFVPSGGAIGFPSPPRVRVPPAGNLGRLDPDAGIDLEKVDPVNSPSSVERQRLMELNKARIKEDASKRVYTDGWVNPMPTSQVFEDWYGDAASWVYGVGRLGVTGMHWLDNKYLEREGGIRRQEAAKKGSGPSRYPYSPDLNAPAHPEYGATWVDPVGRKWVYGSSPRGIGWNDEGVMSPEYSEDVFMGRKLPKLPK